MKPANSYITSFSLSEKSRFSLRSSSIIIVVDLTRCRASNKRINHHTAEALAWPCLRFASRLCHGNSVGSQELLQEV